MGGNSCCFLWRNVACATLYGNDDECVEDFPQDDVDLEERQKHLPRQNGRQEVGGSGEISTRILSSGWIGCFRQVTINETRASAGTKLKANLIRDDLHLQSHAKRRVVR